MTVTNTGTIPVTINVTGVYCMYDNGKDGSNLSVFNNLTVNPGESYPTAGNQGQYIEADAAFGSCSMETSTFTLQFPGVGIASFTESSNTWNGVGQGPTDNAGIPAVSVDVDNSGEQAIITVTVHPG